MLSTAAVALSVWSTAKTSERGGVYLEETYSITRKGMFVRTTENKSHNLNEAYRTFHKENVEGCLGGRCVTG